MNGLAGLFRHFHTDVWMLVGFLGQALFTSRFIVQWIASERRRESVVPLAFWYFSMAGGIVLLIYSLAIGSLPFALGQMTGLFIYARNLWLIRQKAHHTAIVDLEEAK